MAGKFLHGAFIQFTTSFLIPVPNVIIFQFNPESVTHSWTPAQRSTDPRYDNPLAVSGTPGEAFQFSLAMDANETIANGNPLAQGLAAASGVYTRLAALEMLLYPELQTKASELLGVSAAANSAVPGAKAPKLSRKQIAAPLLQLPVVLWVWGPGRILPVKLSSLSVTETLYDSLLLNPTHVEAQVGLQVMTPEEIKFVQGPLTSLARVAYDFSLTLRKTLALANLANAVDSAIGMLPI